MFDDMGVSRTLAEAESEEYLGVEVSYRLNPRGLPDIRVSHIDRPVSCRLPTFLSTPSQGRRTLDIRTW